MDVNKMIKVFDRGILLSIYGMAFFLPISIAFVEIFSTLAFVAFFAKRTTLWKISREEARGETVKDRISGFFAAYKPRPNVLNVPIVVYMVVCLLSVLTSLDIGLSIKGYIFKLTQWILLYVTFLEVFRTRAQVKVFLTLCFLAVLMQGTNGIVQSLRGKGFIRGFPFPEDGRISSTFGHANDLGAYLTLFIPIFLSFMIGRFFRDNQGRDRRAAVMLPVLTRWVNDLLLGVTTLILFFALGLTYSRGAWIAFFVGMVFLGMNRKRAIGILAVVAVLFFSIFINQLKIVRQMSFHLPEKQITQIVNPPISQVRNTGRHQRRSYVSKQIVAIMEMAVGSSMGRDGYWREAEAIIRDYPVLGVGLNTYSKIAPSYKINWGGYPHNCYLHMAAEVGLAGLLAFLWILGRFFWTSLRNTPAIADPFLYALHLGVLGGILGFLVHSVVDTNFYSVQLGNLFWILMGLSVATQKIGISENAA